MLKEVRCRCDDTAFELGNVFTILEGTQCTVRWPTPTAEDLPPEPAPRGNEPLPWNPPGPILEQVIFPPSISPPEDVCNRPSEAHEPTGTHNHKEKDQSPDGEEVIRFVHHRDVDRLGTPVDDLPLQDDPTAGDTSMTRADRDPELIFAAEPATRDTDPLIDEHFRRRLWNAKHQLSQHATGIPVDADSAGKGLREPRVDTQWNWS
jgi:hypothetical protein